MGMNRDMTLAQMRAQMASGTLSSQHIVRHYMQRIGEVDKQGPSINAIRALNMNLLYEAEASDRFERGGGAVGPLFGIPVLVKDNIDVAGMTTTAGSYALRDHYPSEDAPLVAALRRAGALIMGKANMTEWANFTTQGMPNGYSALGGQVLNPFGPNHLQPGGSSSGSGAAVAAGMAPVAIGTETSGSILSPAHNNGVFGLKPTLGLISRRGIIPIAPSQDTAGPIGRSVSDVALMMDVLVGEDPGDGATLGNSMPRAQGFQEKLNANSLQNVRLGVVRGPLERLDDCAKARFEEALTELRSLGAVVVDVELPGMEASSDWRSKVLYYEFKPALNAYLRSVASHLPVHNIEELFIFNLQHRVEELSYGQTTIQAAMELSGSLTEAEYISDRMKDLHSSRDQGIDYGLLHYDVAALIFPGPSAASIAAKAGYPSFNVPLGIAQNNQPMSMTWTSTAFQDALLLSFAFAHEQAFPRKQWPDLSQDVE